MSRLGMPLTEFVNKCLATCERNEARERARSEELNNPKDSCGMGEPGDNRQSPLASNASTDDRVSGELVELRTGNAGTAGVADHLPGGLSPEKFGDRGEAAGSEQKQAGAAVEADIDTSSARDGGIQTSPAHSERSPIHLHEGNDAPLASPLLALAVLPGGTPEAQSAREISSNVIEMPTPFLCCKCGEWKTNDSGQICRGAIDPMVNGKLCFDCCDEHAEDCSCTNPYSSDYETGLEQERNCR